MSSNISDCENCIVTVPVNDLYDDDDDDDVDVDVDDVDDDDNDDDLYDDDDDDDDDNDDDHRATKRARSPKWLRLDQGRASEISALPPPTSTLKRNFSFFL